MIEYLDKAGPILTQPLIPENGMVTARGAGLGLEFEEAALAKFSA
jgi:mandelate racemase